MMLTTRPLDDFVEILSTVSDPDQLLDAVDSHIKWLGFDKFAYHLVRPPGGPRFHFFVTTYPKAWANRYFERGYVNVDPVVAATVRGVTPFQWSTLSAERPLGADQQIVLNEAREFRIKNGLTAPIRGPDRALAEFSVTTEHSSREFDELWSKHRHYLSVFSYYLHEAVLRDLYKPPSQAVVRLSPRERECLLWTAKGKTAWEISEILSLSQDTVIQYLKSAQKKFGVFKKTHAVVKAILLGLITP